MPRRNRPGQFETAPRLLAAPGTTAALNPPLRLAVYRILRGVLFRAGASLLAAAIAGLIADRITGQHLAIWLLIAWPIIPAVEALCFAVPRTISHRRALGRLRRELADAAPMPTPPAHRTPAFEAAAEVLAAKEAAAKKAAPGVRLAVPGATVTSGSDDFPNLGGVDTIAAPQSVGRDDVLSIERLFGDDEAPQG